MISFQNSRIRNGKSSHFQPTAKPDTRSFSILKTVSLPNSFFIFCQTQNNKGIFSNRKTFLLVLMKNIYLHVTYHWAEIVKGNMLQFEGQFSNWILLSNWPSPKRFQSFYHYILLAKVTISGGALSMCILKGFSALPISFPRILFNFILTAFSMSRIFSLHHKENLYQTFYPYKY